MTLKRILIICAVLFIILRIPSLFEPHWYGDEGVYAAVTYAWENGKNLYADVWDNKPIGIYLLYSFGNEFNRLFVIKSLSILFGLFGLVGFSQLLKKLSFSNVAYTLSLFLYTWLLGSNIVEGNIANAENFFMPLATWGMVYGLGKTSRDTFIAGLFFGLGFLIKFHPLFDATAVGLYILLATLVATKTFSFKKILSFAGGFIVPFALFMLYSLNLSTLNATISAMFLENVGYTQKFSIGLLSSQLKLVYLALYVSLISVLFYTKRISHTIYFMLLLIGFEFYGALFSGRRYKHYLIQTIPALSLMSGYLIQQFAVKKHMRQLGNLLIWVIILQASVFVFSLGEGYLLDTRVTHYYEKFIRYAKGETPYFLHNADIKAQLLNDTLQDKYKSQYDEDSIHLYTDNPWFHELIGIPPQTSIITAYHQAVRTDGEKIYSKELQDLEPLIIVRDKDAFMTQSIEDILNTQYSIDYADPYFIYYIRNVDSIGSL